MIGNLLVDIDLICNVYLHWVSSTRNKRDGNTGDACVAE